MAFLYIGEYLLKNMDKKDKKWVQQLP
jgi:hypothetical protein